MSGINTTNNGQVLRSGNDGLIGLLTVLAMAYGLMILLVCNNISVFVDLLFSVFSSIAYYGVCSLLLKTFLKHQSKLTRVLWSGNVILAIMFSFCTGNAPFFLGLVFSFLLGSCIIESIKSRCNQNKFDLARCARLPLWLIAAGLSLMCMLMGTLWFLR